MVNNISKLIGWGILFFILAISSGFGGIPIPQVHAEADLPNCTKLGNATVGAIAPAPADLPANVAAYLGAWQGDWKLEGSNQSTPSAIAFTTATDKSVESIYVFNGFKQSGPGKFTVTSSSTLENTSGDVIWTYRLSDDGKKLFGKREQGTFKANAEMDRCAP